MKNKDRLLAPFIAVLMLSFVFSYGQKKSDQILTIDNFSTFPPEIDGCSCYFSNNSTDFKNEKYIYVNDFAQTSFLKINGVLTKFTQTNFKNINKESIIVQYKCKDYEMTIEVRDGKQSGDETSLKIGTITLSDRNGVTIKKTFHGKCGC